MDKSLYTELKRGKELYVGTNSVGIRYGSKKGYKAFFNSKLWLESDTYVYSDHDFRYVLKGSLLSIYSNGYEKKDFCIYRIVGKTMDMLTHITYIGYIIEDDCAVFGFKLKFLLKDGCIIRGARVYKDYGSKCARQNWMRKNVF